MGNTMTSFKSSKSAQSNKTREREAEAQKLIQAKLHEISHFQGDPPEDE